jgi:hypothetical protein
MKTKIYTILFFTFYSTLTVLLSTCKKDKGDPCAGSPAHTYNYYISDDNKSKIPYTGTDTLIFISDRGDTAKLYGQGKQTYNDVTSKPSSIDPDCSNLDYTYYENIQINFVGNNPNLNQIKYWS